MKPTLTIMPFALAIACGGDRTPQADTTPAAPVVAETPNAAVTIVAPVEGDTTGSDITIVLGKAGVTIEKASGVRVDGIGHHHLFLDTTAVADGEVIPPTSSRVVHIGTGDSTYTFKGLAPGAHEVIAVVGYGDHSAMPARRDTVRFVVRR
ncbi:MAG TPA: DUF4399 domain-containing protein [Gemmatimonadaceae bacterium]|jgi:hypothetical protein|nr:DUF4399 domain-containing protein [Gemmatimonadaceae bacterium]